MFEDASQLAQLIDHTLIRPDATLDDLTSACAQAKEYGFSTLIVNSYHVTRAMAALANSPVKVGTVVGFPHGASTTTVKIVEAMEAMKNGVAEVDIVLNIGLIKSGRYDLMEIDIKNVITMTKQLVHKVIIETGYLTRDEIANTCRTVVHAGAEFIKTSTGYGPRGATVEDVQLIRQVVGSMCRIKASGGIKDLASVIALLEAGAERIGTSSGPAIMDEYLAAQPR